MHLKSLTQKNFAFQILALAVLVIAIIGFSFYAVQSYVQVKRNNEAQQMAVVVTDLLRSNFSNLNARLSFEANQFDRTPDSFESSARKIFQEFPSVIAIELRSTEGALMAFTSKYDSDPSWRNDLRKNLPPWLLADFESVIKVNAPKLTSIYNASLSPIFTGTDGDGQFIAEEFFPLSSGRGAIVVIFNPKMWLFHDSLLAEFKKHLGFRFKLEKQDRELIVSSDNALASPDSVERFVFPITYLTDGPLYLVIEGYQSARAKSAHFLEVALAVLAALIALAVFATFRAWQAYSNTLATLRAQEQQLLDQSKFVSLGEISTILSHELNQPLATIETYSAASEGLLTQEPLDRPRLLKAISAIREENGRISRIIKHIRNFVINNETQVEELDPAALIESLRTILQMQAARYHAQLVINKQAGFLVHVDRLMLEQVILNLARNAYEAMLSSPENQRQLSIAIAYDRPSALGNITFTDTGPGIAEDVARKLFTPFFSTKTDSMGVGLSLCRSLLERYHGSLVWQNNPQGGAQFTISFRIEPASV